MNPELPASTRVRPSRVRNIETERLVRRKAWLHDNKARLAREADSRMQLRHLAREIITIDRELERRSNEEEQ